MPEVRALKSFKGRYGHIRAGQTFTAEPSYAQSLMRNKLVVVTGAAGEPGPSKNRDRKEAPGRGGKDGEGQGRPVPPTDPQPPAAGGTITSASVQAGRVSRPKTLPLSGAGGRRGTPSSRKKSKTKTSSTPEKGAGA